MWWPWRVLSAARVLGDLMQAPLQSSHLDPAGYVPMVYSAEERAVLTGTARLSQVR